MRVSKEVEANKYKIKCGKSTYRIHPENLHNNITVKLVQATALVDNNNNNSAEIAQILNGEGRNLEKSTQRNNKVFVEPKEEKLSDFENEPREDGSKIKSEDRVSPKGRNFKCSKCNKANHHYASRCPSDTQDSYNVVVGDNAADRNKSPKSEKHINRIANNTTEENISEKTAGGKSVVLGTKSKKPEIVLKNQIDPADFPKRRTFTCGKCGKKNEHYKSKCPEAAKENNDHSADDAVDGATKIRITTRANKKKKTVKNPDWKNISIREEHKKVIVERALQRFRNGPTKNEGEGYIYVLKYTYTGENKKKLEESRKYANMFKVGMSIDVTKRIGKLEYDNNLERGHECYTKVFEVDVKRRYIVDQMIKEQLKGTLEQYCPPLVGNGGTEWYKGSKEEIIATIKSVVDFMNLYAPVA